MPGIGIPPLEANLPPILKRNYGQWISHEHPRPGVIKHDSESGEAVLHGARRHAAQRPRQHANAPENL